MSSAFGTARAVLGEPRALPVPEICSAQPGCGGWPHLLHSSSPWENAVSRGWQRALQGIQGCTHLGLQAAGFSGILCSEIAGSGVLLGF